MGNKKKIIILHGWAYSTEKWEPFIKELEKKFEVEMLKIPGLTAPLDEVWNIENYVEWLNQIISKEKGKVILLGHSNGGRISLVFASKYPEKVEKLILIDSAGIYHNELPIRLKRLIFSVIAKAGARFTKSEKFRKVLYKFAREDDYKKANPIVAQTMVNLLKVDCSQMLKNIRIKTLIIWGGRDKITPLSDAKIMNDKIENSKLEIINGARHSPMFTHVKETSKIVIENS